MSSRLSDSPQEPLGWGEVYWSLLRIGFSNLSGQSACNLKIHHGAGLSLRQNPRDYLGGVSISLLRAVRENRRISYCNRWRSFPQSDALSGFTTLGHAKRDALGVRAVLAKASRRAIFAARLAAPASPVYHSRPNIDFFAFLDPGAIGNRKGFTWPVHQPSRQSWKLCMR
jgi:hypothetical protein